jgi:hypothetical protein
MSGANNQTTMHNTWQRRAIVFSSEVGTYPGSVSVPSSVEFCIKGSYGNSPRFKRVEKMADHIIKADPRITKLSNH